MSSSGRAIILGGTGAMGGATALRLAADGWSVEVTGRNPASMPQELSAAGVRFHSIDRSDVESIERLVGDGAELLMDVLAYRAADVRALLPAMASVDCPVLISSRAVYVDPDGHHVNSDEPAKFPGAINESAPTQAPADDDVDPFTREGYAPSKVAAERAALDSGLPVTVIRPSKVHGRWARDPRMRSFVEPMLAGERVIELARGGSIDHLSAAANTAALIVAVAGQPEARILNSADPDSPTAEQIARAIGARLGWTGTLKLLHNVADPERGRHPWFARHPIVLDTTASAHLGYVPEGAGLDLLTDEVDWLAGQVHAG